MKNNIVLYFLCLERSLKMEINSKDELKSAIDEIMSRLSVVEQYTTEKKEDEQPKDEKPKEKQSEVESADEIEKLLNS